MKKTFIIALSAFMVILSMISVAGAQAQKIWGECIAMSPDGFIIATEDGNVAATDGTGKSYGLLGMIGWYTIENGVITAFEEIPEYGFEIGYLSQASTDFNGRDVLLEICKDEKLNISLENNIKINGTSYNLRNSANEVAELLNANKGFIGYKTETYLDEETNEVISVKINNIIFIESKRTEYDKKQSDFSSLTYKITDDTQVYFSSEDGNYYMTEELPAGENYYSFDVISYDKEYNARAVAINEVYGRDVAFYSYKMGYYYSSEGIVLKAVDSEGIRADLLLDEDYSDSGIMDTLSGFDGIIEYKKNTEGFVTEIVPLEVNGTFEDAEVSDGKIGEYVINDVVAFEVVDNNNSWSYTKADFSDKYLYSGTVYVNSENKTILWISLKNIAGGMPIIDFSSKDRGDNLRVYADIDLNGYTGGGMVYVAVYKDGRMVDMFAFNLADNDGIMADDDEISGRIYYEENETGSDFTVRGFAWDETFSPLIPAVDVRIR